MQALSCALRNKLGMIQRGQDPSRLAKQNLACYCERHISSITIEKRDAELPLKRGALDVGLLYGTVDGPGFSCQVIWAEPLVAAIPRSRTRSKGGTNFC